MDSPAGRGGSRRAHRLLANRADGTFDYFLLRASATAAAFVLSVIGVILIVISGWLGSNLVYQHGAGVETVRTPAAPAEADYRERRAG